MFATNLKQRFLIYLIIALLTGLLSGFSILMAGINSPSGQDAWWDIEPEDEKPASQYDSILYSEIGPKLRELITTSNRVKVDVIGQSAGGRNLFLVTVSAPEAMGLLGKYQAISQTMLEDPDKAIDMIERFGDFKVPFFVNASIHGDEYPGTDAAIRLIETLAYEDSPEVQAILENVILLVNVVQNPDGRVLGIRQNSNGIDINRDFITQSQPESRATVNVVEAWNPMVFLDLHGFVNPMLIEPCTPPHNPNYEYDLYLKWALNQAFAMEAELAEKTGLSAQIPYRDDSLGWDDWAPIYAAMYPIYHGSYAHTLETPFHDLRGVAANYAAVWGALKFVAANKQAMFLDQIEIYRRGILDLPQVLIPKYLLDKTQYEQFNELTVTEFPAAYVIPKGRPFQVSSHQPARLIDFLLFNGVKVEKTNHAFTLNEIEYPEGTYIVRMDQPKRGLAKVILEDGLDLSSIAGLEFYSPPSVWSNSLLWGASAIVMEENLGLDTNEITKADPPIGVAEGDQANVNAYAFLPTSISAFQAINNLLGQKDTKIFRATLPFEDSGRSFGAGTFIVLNDMSVPNQLVDQLVDEYALDLFALSALPEDITPMARQRIAVYGDPGLRYALNKLGFEFDSVETKDLNKGVIAGYDVFINRGLAWSSLNHDGETAMTSWYAAGGNYVGLAYQGGAIDFARDAQWVTGIEYSTISGNAILKLDYTADDSVAAGFYTDEYAFVYQSVWFTKWPEDMQVSASIDSEYFLVSGYWEGWEDSEAGGMPIILHGSTGTSDVTLIGINNTFRCHPEDTFRILGNAIYNGLD